MNEEKTIHKFLNKVNNKKIYDVWVDRHTCNRWLLKFWCFGESPPKTSPSKPRSLERKKLIHEQNFNAAFLIPVLLQHFLLKSKILCFSLDPAIILH